MFFQALCFFFRRVLIAEVTPLRLRETGTTRRINNCNASSQIANVRIHSNTCTETNIVTLSTPVRLLLEHHRQRRAQIQSHYRRTDTHRQPNRKGIREAHFPISAAHSHRLCIHAADHPRTMKPQAEN